MKNEINTRLYYALGDIEPTSRKMKRAVESISNLIESERKKILEEIENVRWADISKEQALERIKNKIDKLLK